MKPQVQAAPENSIDATAAKLEQEQAAAAAAKAKADEESKKQEVEAQQDAAAALLQNSAADYLAKKKEAEKPPEMPAPPSPLEKVGTFIASIPERLAAAFSPEKMAPVAEDSATGVAPVAGTLISAPKNGVPSRVKALFKKLDADGDGKLTLQELTNGFEREFKGKLAAHAKEAIPTLFEKHCKADASGVQHLGRQLFNRFYAEILFKTFDADNNGWLSLQEAQTALQYLRRKPQDGSKPEVSVAYPADAYTPEGELRLPKAWFLQVYKSMDDSAADRAGDRQAL